MLSELADNEIREWTMFYNNLQIEYAKNRGTKGVAKTSKGKRLGRKV